MSALLVHTSDRIQFKNCRRSWNWQSPLRCSLRSPQEPEALWFGTAVHEGLEAHSLGKDGVKAFLDHCTANKLAFLGTEPSVEQDIRYQELRDLGSAMISGYAEWVEKNNLNKNLVVVGTEVRFLVPIIPEHDVWYAGKADTLYFDKRTGLLWVGEYKTAAQFNNPDLLAWDEQVGSYNWAFEAVRQGHGRIDERGLLHPELFWEAKRLEGVIYDDLRKKAPKIPQELVKGGVSQNKQQDTTFEVYHQFLIDHGYNPAGYASFLEFLKSKPNNFFRRERVRRNASELNMLGANIRAEAVDMVNPNLPLYPNPGYRASNCQRCSFNNPCLAMNDGGDPQQLLDEFYVVKGAPDGDGFFDI